MAEPTDRPARPPARPGRAGPAHRDQPAARAGRPGRPGQGRGAASGRDGAAAARTGRDARPDRDPDAGRGAGAGRNPGSSAGRDRGSAGRQRAAEPADPARRAAVDLLGAVRERAAYANLALPALLRERRLSGRDAAFATELSYGTLRAQGTLDAIIARAAGRPAAEIDPPVLDVLRLGAYQLLRTRVPAHAAVSATVALARAAVGPRPVGFVNAVLRRVAERDEDAWLAAVAPPYEADPVGNLAVRHAHPQWIVAAFADALGGDLAAAAGALAADNDRPELHLVARPGRIDRATLAEESGGEPGRWSPYAVRLPDGGDPGALAAVRDGRGAVQDEGSQLCAIAAVTAPVEGRDERWLDLCAGPGGKAALLGALAALRPAAPAAATPAAATPADASPAGAPPAGAAPAAAEPAGAGPYLLAVERQPARARLVAGTTAGLPVSVLQADGTVPAWLAGTFDRVLLDAPCTGLGALRRRPEARWRRQPTDLPPLTALQRRLLAAAVEATRPGGVCTYVTCSPHLAETRAVIAEACRRLPVEQLDARPFFPDVAELGPGPHVQLWPHRHGTDAMFCAVLRRR